MSFDPKMNATERLKLQQKKPEGKCEKCGQEFRGIEGEVLKQTMEKHNLDAHTFDNDPGPSGDFTQYAENPPTKEELLKEAKPAEKKALKDAETVAEQAPDTKTAQEAAQVADTVLENVAERTTAEETKK